MMLFFWLLFRWLCSTLPSAGGYPLPNLSFLAVENQAVAASSVLAIHASIPHIRILHDGALCCFYLEHLVLVSCSVLVS